MAEQNGNNLSSVPEVDQDAITAFSARPLRIGLYAGIFLLGLSWVGILYSLISWAFFSTEPGWTSLIIAVMFLGGAQIFMLAMIGEYVSRTFVQTKGRPLFLFQELVGASRKPDAPK